MTKKKEHIAVHAEPVRGGAPGETLTPLVDVYESSDGSIVLKAEVPGAASEGINIRVDNGVLTLEADARLEEFGERYAWTYQGFEGGHYFRAFALSDEFDRDRIEASLSCGMLTIRLPRAASAKTRKIEIRGE